MEDEELMSRVDLIIGPFFASQFEIAANYAKTYQIPIVNPFTSKRGILEENEYVYKVQSSTEAVAEMVKNRWVDHGDETEIFFWTERGGRGNSYTNKAFRFSFGIPARSECLIA